MSTFPSKLTQWKQELQHQPSPQLARAIVQDYLRQYSPQEIKEELWMLTVAALTHPEQEKTNDPIGRHNRLFFFEFHQLFLEAVVHLHKEKETG